MPVTTSELPAPHVLLCELDSVELSPRAGEQLARIRAFLYVVNLPQVQTSALLAGYGPEIHSDGAHRASLVSGERSFHEWRTWRSLRPPRDPDLPELVEQLDRFRRSWQRRALEAARTIEDGHEREEIERQLSRGSERPSRTWRAKAWAAAIAELARGPLQSHQGTWARLVEQGIEPELERFHDILVAVQEHIRNAELDAEELADIHRHREEAVVGVEEWLDARRRQFAERMAEETLVLLALGEPVPPPLRDMSIQMLGRFRVAGSA